MKLSKILTVITFVILGLTISSFSKGYGNLQAQLTSTPTFSPTIRASPKPSPSSTFTFAPTPTASLTPMPVPASTNYSSENFTMETFVRLFEIATAAVLAFLSGRYLKTLDRHKERDKEVFDTLLQQLPMTGGILYIVKHDMAAGMRFSHIQELFRFVEYSEDHPDFIFINKRLEKKRKLLIDKLRIFLRKLTEVTETIRDEPLTIKLPQGHLYDDPDYWRNTREELNQKSDEVYEIYSQLIKDAQKRL